MANVKITELTELAAVDVADNDVVPIVDVGGDTTKKVTAASLRTSLAAANDFVTFTVLNSNLNVVQDNVATNATDITSLETRRADNVTIFINAFTGTNTNIGTVSSNADAYYTQLNANIDIVQDNVTSQNSYITSTYAPLTLLDSVQDNVASAEANVNALRVEYLANVASTEANVNAVELRRDSNTFYTYNTDGGQANIRVFANVEPFSNNTYSLGAPDLVWKDLHVGPGTIFLGNVTIAPNETGSGITITGADASTTTIDTATSNVTASLNLLQDNVASAEANVVSAETRLNANLDVIQDNVSAIVDATAVETRLNANLDITNDNVTSLTSTVDNFGTYANTNLDTKANVSATYFLALANDYATHTQLSANLDIVQDNVATVTSTVDSFGTYANTTFDTKANVSATYIQLSANVDVVQDNLSIYTGSSNAGIRVAVEQFGNLALQSNTIDFALLNSFSPTHSEGRVYYDTERNSLRVAGPSITSNLHVGQDEFIYVRNTSGATIDRVKPVYLVSEDGGIPTIALANAATETTAYVAGLTADQIADGDYGFVQRAGIVFGDTTGLTAGNRIHLGPEAGLLQETAPTYPYFTVDIGIVLITDATNGCIYIDMTDHFAETYRVTGSAYIDSDLTVGGNLSVLGSESITSVNSLAVANSLMYLNSGDTIGDSATVFIGSGLDDATLVGHYNGPITEQFNVRINATGTPDTFDWSLDNFTSREAVSVAITGGEQSLANGISITFEATTGHTIGDEWGGVAAPTQVDTGWVSNRNAGLSEPGYTHLGMFFDISDAKFKMFDEYDPEPNAAIDTTDGSFSYGDLVLSTLESTVATGTAPFTVASTTLVTNLNADLLDGVQGSAFDTRANASAGFIQLNSNINVVQDNVTTVTTTVDNFGTYANTTLDTKANVSATLFLAYANDLVTYNQLNANVDLVQDNVASITSRSDAFGTYANSTFSTVSNAGSLAAGIATKLDAADYTASDVLTKVKTVDGAGSGLDADLLDGQSSAYYAVESIRSSNAAELAAGIAAVPTGDITAVTAGSGLTGGGTSGSVTLNIGAGTGVTVNADAIAIGQAVGTGDSPTFAGLTVTTFDLGAL